MPEELKRKLRKSYRKQGLKGKQLENAVYGTLTNIEKKKGLDVHGNPMKKPVKRGGKKGK